MDPRPDKAGRPFCRGTYFGQNACDQLIAYFFVLLDCPVLLYHLSPRLSRRRTYLPHVVPRTSTTLHPGTCMVLEVRGGPIAMVLCIGGED